MNIRISCIKIFLLFLIPHLSFGQSLDKVVKEALATFNYGKDYCSYIDSLIDQANLRKYGDEVIEIHGLKALCFNSSVELDSIKYYLNTLSSGSSRRAKGLMKSIEGDIQMNSGQNELAIQSITDAIDLYDKKRDIEFIILSYLEISWLHYGTYTFETAIKYAEEAYKLSAKSGNRYGMIDALDILANCYGRLNQLEKSDSLFQEYLAISRSIENLTVSYWSSCAAGNNFEFRGQHDSASFYFEAAYQTALLLKDSSFQIEALLYIGENAQRKGENLMAIQSLSKVNQFPKKFQRVAIQRRLKEYLSNAHAAIGKYKEAYEYLSDYKTIEEDNWNEETRVLTLDFEAKYQSLLKDNEISRQELTISKNRAQRNAIALSALAIGCLMWFLFYRSQKNQKIALQKIQTLEKQQKLLALDFMVQGQEEERKRIAQDLHDGLGGLLSTARLQLQKVQSEIEKLSEINILGKTEAMIDNACSEVRRIAHDMMPGALTDLGLIEAVEDLSHKLSQKTELSITVEDKTAHLHLSDVQKIQIYRTIQEIISNSIRHANAKEILVIFSQSASFLQVQVSDDGSGFDYAEAIETGGLGLKNISSRIQYLNGSIEVSTERDNGTIYHLTIPTENPK